MIYVTHDQTEALTFADEVVVLNDGEVVQTGEPTDLFLEPAHEFVGHFIGSPGMNVLPAEVLDGGAVLVGDQPVGTALEVGGGDGGAVVAPGPAHVGVRPEFVTVDGNGSGGDGGDAGPGVVAVVRQVQRMGAYDLVHGVLSGGAADGARLVAKVGAGSPAEAGTRWRFAFDPGRVFLFRDSVRVARVGQVTPGVTAGE
jgi:glycerol transport system ATP-binding protein